MASFDRYARWYDVIRRPPTEELLALARPRKTDRVLDIGGGTGVVAAALKPLVQEVIVLDPSSGMLAQAKARGLKAVLGSTDSIPFPAKAFDLIICTDAFHHVQDQMQALKEMRRVLKRNGRVIFEEYNPSTFSGASVAFIEWLTRCHSKFHTPERMSALLARNGLSADTIQRSGVYFIRSRRIT